MACAIVATVAAPAVAQDLGGVYDLGQMGRDMSQAATVSAQGRRSAATQSDAQVAREIAANCRKLRSFKRPSGSLQANYDKGIALCRARGL